MTNLLACPIATTADPDAAIIENLSGYHLHAVDHGKPISDLHKAYSTTKFSAGTLKKVPDGCTTTPGVHDYQSVSMSGKPIHGRSVSTLTLLRVASLPQLDLTITANVSKPLGLVQPG